MDRLFCLAHSIKVPYTDILKKYLPGRLGAEGRTAGIASPKVNAIRNNIEWVSTRRRPAHVEMVLDGRRYNDAGSEDRGMPR